MRFSRHLSFGGASTSADAGGLQSPARSLLSEPDSEPEHEGFAHIYGRGQGSQYDAESDRGEDVSIVRSLRAGSRPHLSLPRSATRSGSGPNSAAERSNARSSYFTSQTSETGTSRISGLSDFPIPPDYLAEPGLDQSPRGALANGQYTTSPSMHSPSSGLKTGTRFQVSSPQVSAVDRSTTYTVDSIYSQV